MFKDLGWLSVPGRLDYSKSFLTYGAINKISPEYISNHLKPMSETHTRNLQSSANGLLYVPKARFVLYEIYFPVL